MTETEVGFVSGNVSDQTGLPVPGCIITIHSSEYDIPEFPVVSDRDGKFQWPAGISFGHVRISAASPDKRTGDVAAHIDEREKFIAIVLAD